MTVVAAHDMISMKCMRACRPSRSICVGRMMDGIKSPQERPRAWKRRITPLLNQGSGEEHRSRTIEGLTSLDWHPPLHEMMPQCWCEVSQQIARQRQIEMNVSTCTSMLSDQIVNSTLLAIARNSAALAMAGKAPLRIGMIAIRGR